MISKKSFLTGLAFLGLIATDASAALSTDDFVEAAWMTTRFFGAQRSGEGPNWVLDGTNHTTSFLKDSYNGKDVSGGWFDCGDHVMFGQSQGYASYVLALGYAEFTEGFYDLYTGDYTDYKSSKDYTRAGGKANKVRDLLEELRYEADFWSKAAISDNAFVTVKGDGNMDHNKWVTAGMMSTLGTGDGGDPRPITGNANDGYTPGMAAAMLAIMARVDPDTARQEKYLKAAKTAFSYAKSHKGVTNSTGFYESKWWEDRWQDGPFLAALELYRTTKDESYKKEAEDWFSEVNFDMGAYAPFSYANPVPLSVVVASGVFDWDPERGQLKSSKIFLNYLYNRKKDDNGIFNLETGGAGKFSVRTPAGGAFLYALYSKYTGDDSFDDLIEKNIAFLLGDNKDKKSYVVGFNRNSAKAPTSPHHRGYYANEDPGREVDSGLQPPEKNKLLGGMIAGDFTSGSHSGTVSNWQVNEVCVDLNAPLVGALGFILSKKAPKTDYDIEKADKCHLLIAVGEPLVDTLVECNTDFELPNAKDSTGYTFVGWYDGNDRIGGVGDMITVSEEISVDAKYSAISYHITFVDYDGNEIFSGNFDYGTATTIPADPTRASTVQNDYVFAGWVPEVSKTVLGTATYTASYIEKKRSYVIVATVNDDEMGSVSGLSETGEYEYDTEVELTATAKAGYEFSNWNDDVKTAERTIKVTGDQTYTATFKAIPKSSSSSVVPSKVKESSSSTKKSSSSSKSKTSIAMKFVSPAVAQGTACVFDLQGRYLGTLQAEQLRNGDLAQVLHAQFRNPGVYLVRYGNELKKVTVK